jgi:hypothetical protein
LNTQELVDWAFAQECAVPVGKLILVGMALSAGPEGGGKVTIERPVQCASAKERTCRIHLKRLAERGLVVYRVTDNVVTYGLSVSDRAS